MITVTSYVVLYFCGLIGAFKKPIYGIYAYLLAFYLNPIGTWWGSGLPSLRWSLIAAIVTLAAAVIHQKKHKPSKQPPENSEQKVSGFNIALVLFAVWLVLQNLWALDKDYQYEFTVIFIKFVILYWLIIKTCDDEKTITWFIVANGLGCGYLGWYGKNMVQSGRLEGIGPPGLEDANFLALHLISVIIMVSFILLAHHHKSRFLLIPPIILMLNCVVLTQSRGAMVGLVAAALFIVLFMPKAIRKQMIVYGLLGICAIAVTMDNTFYKRITSTTSATSTEELDKVGAYSRIIIVKSQWQMFLDNSVLGTGHRGTMILSPEYIPHEYMTKSDGKLIRSSHNTYMSLLVEQGFIGLFLFLLFIWGAFRRCYRILKVNVTAENEYLKNITLGIGASLFGFLATALFVDTLRLEIIIWQVALIYIIYGKLYKKALLPRIGNKSIGNKSIGNKTNLS